MISNKVTSETPHLERKTARRGRAAAYSARARLRGRIAAAVLLGMLGAGCSVTAPQPESGNLHVVAAESVWGSIAAQLGGNHVAVTDIIRSPAIDPHDYDPTSSDARAFATADLVVVNGIGYDPWATKLLAPGAVHRRLVVDVGAVTGTRPGGNPHRWYDPADVVKVAHAITAAYQQLQPAERSYFAQRYEWFTHVALAEYHSVIAEIRARYAGVPVGASESMFALLTPALGLRLVTPPGFLRAVSEGADPTVADKQTILRQLADREIRVYLFNAQNTTPDVEEQVRVAKAHGIPVVPMTEMLDPPSASFQQWQVAQLLALERALAEGVTA